MKFNVKQMLVCVSENGYLIQKLAKEGYSNSGKYYYNLAMIGKVNKKLEKELRINFNMNKEKDFFIADYNDAANRIPEPECVRFIKAIEIGTKNGIETLCICRVNNALVGFDGSFIELLEDKEQLFSPYDGQYYDYSEEVNENISLIADHTATKQ